MGEGVVRLEPCIDAEGIRTIASLDPAHPSCVAIGAKRIPLYRALAELSPMYLGAANASWGQDGETEAIELEPASCLVIKSRGPYAALVTQGEGVVSRIAVHSPALEQDGRLTPDEVFVTAEAAHRGILYRNNSETTPLLVTQFFGTATL